MSWIRTLSTRIGGETEPPNLPTETNTCRGVFRARTPQSPVRMRPGLDHQDPAESRRLLRRCRGTRGQSLQQQTEWRREWDSNPRYLSVPRPGLPLSRSRAASFARRRPRRSDRIGRTPRRPRRAALRPPTPRPPRPPTRGAARRRSPSRATPRGPSGCAYAGPGTLVTGPRIAPDLCEPAVPSTAVAVVLVADRILLIVVLVVLLGGPELTALHDLRHDAPFELAR